VLTNTKFNGNALFNTTVGHDEDLRDPDRRIGSASDRVTLTSSYIDGNQLVNTLAGGKGLQVGTSGQPRHRPMRPHHDRQRRYAAGSGRHPTRISARARASCSRPSTT
jgi:hypothetical protein